MVLLYENDFYYIQELIFDYLELNNENMIYMFKNDFYDDLIDEIIEFLFNLWEDIIDDENKENIEDIIFETVELYYDFYDIPTRTSDYFNQENNEEPHKINIPILQNTIKCLKNTIMPQQKTKEWYEIRQNLLSASTIWKALSSESNYNSLIYEKCSQIKNTSNLDEQIQEYTNTENSLHWGVKYEPVSVMIYEKLYNTVIDNTFGCIIHSKYNFIGASPDGINVCSKSLDKFGRMIEIKNIVNREITGIPIDAYWIQIQLQLEVCNLNECDFFETRIMEYNNEEEFINSIDLYKGVILYFIKKNSIYSPIYEYMPLNIQDYNIWINDKIKEKENDFLLFKKIFWHLDEYSCVLVLKNNFWFNSVLPIFKKMWDTILFERENGYDHRLSVRRKQNQDKKNSSGKGICVVKLE